jgi:hypothetical protein
MLPVTRTSFLDLGQELRDGSIFPNDQCAAAQAITRDLRSEQPLDRSIPANPPPAPMAARSVTAGQSPEN